MSRDVPVVVRRAVAAKPDITTLILAGLVVCNVAASIAIIALALDAWRPS